MLVFRFRGFLRLSQVKSYHTASLEDYSIVSMSAYARIRSYIHFILAGSLGVSLYYRQVACGLVVFLSQPVSNSGGSANSNAKKRTSNLECA